MWLWVKKMHRTGTLANGTKRLKPAYPKLFNLSQRHVSMVHELFIACPDLRSSYVFSGTVAELKGKRAG